MIVFLSFFYFFIFFAWIRIRIVIPGSGSVTNFSHPGSGSATLQLPITTILNILSFYPELFQLV